MTRTRRIWVAVGAAVAVASAVAIATAPAPAPSPAPAPAARGREVSLGAAVRAAGTAGGTDAGAESARGPAPEDLRDGCTVGYGAGQACLPVNPPSATDMGMDVAAMPWTCAEARTLLPAGITLDQRGIDPARLDTDGDGTACSPDDR